MTEPSVDPTEETTETTDEQDERVLPEDEVKETDTENGEDDA